MLNNLGIKYNTNMNSHDLDILMTNLFTPRTVLKRNTKFELNKLNILNFIKDIYLYF